jgi:hypothetical protein
MCPFNHPASILRRTPPLAFLSRNPWDVAPRADLLMGWLPVISLIRIQESELSVRKGNNNRIEHGRELTDIMAMSPGNDQRQRDATPVHEEMTLAPFFSPGLWGSGRRHPARGVL